MTAPFVICPYCHRPAALCTGADIYPHRYDLAGKNFWRCQPCGAWVGCHPAAQGKNRGLGDGTVPMGRLANSQLRREKQHAHQAFDALWLNDPDRRGARDRAYRWLADTLGMKPAICHIGMFDVQQCRAVVAAVQQRRLAA